MNERFDLSVVIPTYNEQDYLPRLLRQLWQQRDIALQIIVVDGGSRDGTIDCLQHAFTENSSRFVACCTAAHRAKQLNLGATLASADTVLFLHADSDLGEQPTLLHAALSALVHANRQSRCAGHFPLIFNETQGQHAFAFYYYAAKTALNRIDVINGDQGFMLPVALFTALQGFDDSLPYMEDARLANRLLAEARWITLPGQIQTSARRFLQEGLKKRQLLNSFICNFNAIGLYGFFQKAAQAYKRQSDTEQLQLLPFLKIIHHEIAAQGIGMAFKYWYLTGRYILQNSWQLFFAADCRHAYRHGMAAHAVSPRRLNFFDRWLAPWLLSPPFNLVCAVLTYCWFYSLFIVYRK